MKDYNYFLPGYTGFCPNMIEHIGEGYSPSTHTVLQERPQDRLKERLSPVGYHCHLGDGWFREDYANHCCSSGCDRERGWCGCAADPASYCFENPNQVPNMYSQGKENFYPMYSKSATEERLKYCNCYLCQPYRPPPCNVQAPAYVPPPPIRRQRLRVIPYRQCGVIPHYTGHIPAMQFMFGESYGPASDRLLRRHQENLRKRNLYL